jgi:choline monooxygenase
MNSPLLCAHTNTPLAEVQGQLRTAAARPFDQARPAPAAINHSLAFAAEEQKTLFQQEWICVGRADEIARPGDFMTHEIAGVPVLIVRQAGGQINAFVNACAHRFACLTKETTGTAKRFTCPYHAWTYGLDGELIRAPFMEMKDSFDPTQHRLRSIASEVWEGFLYISLSDNPRPLHNALALLTQNIIGRFDMARYQTVMREEMIWGANWKNLIENFTESYHVPMAHKKTFAKHGKPLTAYVCGEDHDHYCYHRAPQQADTGGGAAHAANDRLTGEWRRMMIDFCIFPSQLVTLMPDSLWYISVQPHGVDQFRATWGVAIPPEVLADVPPDEYDGWLHGLRDYMNIANGEDKILVGALHRGTASPLLPDGALHPIERNLWQFTQYLSRMCGGVSQG